MPLVFKFKISQSLRVQLEAQATRILTTWISAGTTTVSTFWLLVQPAPSAKQSSMLCWRTPNPTRSDFSAEMTATSQHRFKDFAKFQPLINKIKEFTRTNAISLTQLRLRPRFIKPSEIWRDNLMLFSSVTELSISWVVLTATCQNGISFTRSM
mgnify:CR=1 FL=1